MATKIHIEIPLGDTFRMTIFHVRDQYGNIVNMANLVGYCNLKKNYTASNAYSIPCSFNANGDVILQGGVNTLANVVAGRYVYDVVSQDLSTGDVTRVVEGFAYLSPQVSVIPTQQQLH